MFLSAFVWKINPFTGEIAVFQVKLAAILKMADPPIVTDTFCPNNPDYLFIDIKWPPKPLVFYTKVKKVSHSGNPTIMGTFQDSHCLLSLIYRLLNLKLTRSID